MPDRVYQIRDVLDMLIICEIMVSETRHNEELVEVTHLQAYTRKYEYKEEGGYNKENEITSLKSLCWCLTLIVGGKAMATTGSRINAANKIHHVLLGAQT